MLSSSVANALEYIGNRETKETEAFVRHFDRFFNCLNVRSIEEGYKKRKEDLQPYTSPDDKRLKVITTLLQLLTTLFHCYNYYDNYRIIIMSCIIVIQI